MLDSSLKKFTLMPVMGRPVDINLDFKQIMHQNNPASDMKIKSDGHNAARRTQIEITANGQVLIKADNGEEQKVAKIVIATCADPDAVENVGGLWVVNNRSGSPTFADAGQNGAPALEQFKYAVVSGEDQLETLVRITENAQAMNTLAAAQRTQRKTMENIIQNFV
jgi:flagellar basal body rod protein FlgG